MALPRKGTILMPSGTAVDPGRKHLFVVCTDPCTACEQVIVPILTFTNTLCDQTCVISAKEHEFIKHKSYVSYRHSSIRLSAALMLGVEEGIFKPQEDMNGQTFLRVFKGLSASNQTPRKVKAYLLRLVPPA